MGKWSKITYPPEFDQRRESLRVLSPEEIEERWMQLGQPTTKEFRMGWYSGISGDGWACIDNDDDFQLPIDRYDFISQNEARLKYWEQLACVLAVEAGCKRGTNVT